MPERRPDDERPARAAAGAPEASADRQLAVEVARRLAAEELLGPYDIHVEARDGRVVLQGVVDVLAEKQAAERAARQVPGVRQVENDLTLSTDGAITDADVQMEVAEELSADPVVAPRHLGVRVAGGVARLLGRVASDEEERAALSAAAKARGVVDVVSELEVEPEIAGDPGETGPGGVIPVGAGLQVEETRPDRGADPTPPDVKQERARQLAMEQVRPPRNAIEAAQRGLTVPPEDLPPGVAGRRPEDEELD